MRSGRDAYDSSRLGSPRILQFKAYTDLIFLVMSALSDFILHVGLPKTATSALQQKYLSRHPGLTYIALERKGGAPDPEQRLNAFVRWIRTEDDLGPQKTKQTQFITALVTSARRRGKPVLFSEERFTGHFGAGWRAKAQFAYEVFPDARILISIRKPVDLLRSNYFQHLRHPRPDHPPVGDFDAFARMSIETADELHSYGQTILLHNIVRQYKDLFGRDRRYGL